MSVSSQKTTLYRAYNSENELLYVGISHSVMARIGQHKNAGVWHGKCVRITLEHFATRELARKAENKAIKKEYPIYNKQGKPSGFDDYWKNKRQQERSQEIAEINRQRKERYGWKDLDITVMIDPPNTLTSNSLNGFESMLAAAESGFYTSGSAAELNYSEPLKLTQDKIYVDNKLDITEELYDKLKLDKYGRKYFERDRTIEFSTKL